MAAFEKVASGITEMDHALEYIRLGDNVVWQVSTLEEFRYFVQPFVQQAVADGRNIIYIRFASHEPLVDITKEVNVYHVELSHRFETFTDTIHQIIEAEGYDALYVFDCLSELQVAWSTDLMMGNFFKVTCPFLFQLDTIAYFPIIRGRHSYQAIAKIRETTQLFLDVYGCEEKLYVSPLKVWNRYTPTMFLPHLFLPEQEYFRPITDGIEVAGYYQIRNQYQLLSEEQETDSWDRFFGESRQKVLRGTLTDSDISKMCKIMMTREGKLREIICSCFTGTDLLAVRQRMIGTGMIGGKACGMLLARKLIQKLIPEAEPLIEPHDSYFIGADVFYTYLIENDCWDMRMHHRTGNADDDLNQKLHDRLLTGEFPEEIREKFRRMLDYYGRNPIIVRSSSILEDGFNHAFAGKYESIFCVNSGSAEERLEAFEMAVRSVYASTMNPDALEYRRKRHILEKDEQMAILVQRVSGSYFQNLFFPHAAGVGYSYSTYRINQNMDPSQGILRLVMGLGTKAVDRTDGAYPRLMSLDQPLAFAQTNVADRHRYSQRKVDVLDMEKNEKAEVRLESIISLLDADSRRMLLEHDTEAERTFRDRGIPRNIYFTSFKGLAGEEKFIQLMRKIMSVLEECYGVPVDIEYTVNLGNSGAFTVNILQCRPLHVAIRGAEIAIPENQKEQTVLEMDGFAMGASQKTAFSTVVLVDPYEYYRCPYHEKGEIARTIGRVNTYLKENKETALLLVPGRIGTSSPELGVPVSFSEISCFHGIVEIGYSEIGYVPELSYGSHFFQDLVEEDIFYCAAMENAKRKIFNLEILERMPNQLNHILPGHDGQEHILKVFQTGDIATTLYYDMKAERTKIILNTK